MLPRFEQEIQRSDTPLGVDYLLYLLRLSRGYPSDKRDLFFYEALADKQQLGSIWVAPDPLTAMQMLRDAWWIEDEDILQFCLFYIGTTKYNWKIPVFKYYLTWALAKYLAVDQQAFARQRYLDEYEPYTQQLALDNQYRTTSSAGVLSLEDLIRITGQNLTDTYYYYLYYCFQYGIGNSRLKHLTRIGRQQITECVRLEAREHFTQHRDEF